MLKPSPSWTIFGEHLQLSLFLCLSLSLSLTYKDIVRRWSSTSQKESSYYESNWLASWSWTASLQSCKEINSCFLNHPVCGILLGQPELTNTSSRVAVCFWNLTRNNEFPRTFFISVSQMAMRRTGLLLLGFCPESFLLLFLFKKTPFHRHVPIWGVKGELSFSICFLSLLASLSFRLHYRTLSAQERMCWGHADALMYG